MTGYLYLLETRFVPLERGMSPLALRDDRIVKPMDFPCLYRRR
jgi:hypothetical protein